VLFGLLPKLKHIMLFVKRDSSVAVEKVFTRQSQTIGGSVSEAEMEVEILEEFLELKIVLPVKKQAPKRNKLFGIRKNEVKTLFPLVSFAQ